jgi:MFS family permease
VDPPFVSEAAEIALGAADAALDTNRRRIYAAAFLRAVATSMTGVLVGLFLARLGFSAGFTGLVVGLGLGGAAFAAFLATARADRWGRRRFLVGVSLATLAGVLCVAAASHAVVIALAAFFGMLNGMGRDRGASLIVEQAILPSTATDAERTKVFAWYNVVQDAGAAIGALLAGLPAWLRGGLHWGELDSTRAALAIAGLLALPAVFIYFRLSASAESASPAARVTISPGSRRVLGRISALFALDSLGGGFLTSALLSWFFFERFGVNEVTIGLLFFGARVLNAFSHLGAAWLAKRIGLVNTMVWTHVPSSLLLASVAIAPNFTVAAVLFLLREGLVEMDVPTRQSYVMAVVRPEERTFASGVTHLVRMAAWAVGAPIAGAAMQGLSLASPLVAAAGMKIAYDLLLWRAFRNVKPPEEA